MIKKLLLILLIAGAKLEEYSVLFVPNKSAVTLDKFATTILNWDSGYLRRYVDSAGTIPPNVDLRTLHLKTATQTRGTIR